MLVISIHMSLASPGPHTPETNDVISTEKMADENHLNPTNPILIVDKDTPLGSLSTARCCFGIASLNDIIYIVGVY